MSVLKMKLSAARINADLSQRKAAKLLGISKDTLRLYEQYKLSPKVDLAFSMAKLYNCSIGDLIFLSRDNV